MPKINKLLAPNGRPSNLSPKQYKLVRTKAFKDWFGDWENDPANASKVVDENGEPLVVYHGTNSDFYKFTKTKGRGKKNQSGIYLSDNPSVAKLYGDRILMCFASIKNPFTKDYKGSNYHELYGSSDLEVTAQFYRSKNKISNVDGVIFYNIKDALNRFDVAELGNNYIPFNSNQIKLADGSNTAFDASNPDIRFELGGIYHGSPYRFDKFSTAHMGSGEGAQAFGWGLYFTELEDIANRYAKIKQNSEAFAQYIYGTGYTADDVEAIERMTNAKLKEKIIEKYEDRVAQINSKHKSNTDFKQHLLDTALKLKNTYLDDVAQLTPTKYRVTLHKGKTPILSARYQVLGNLIVPKKDPNMPFEEFAAKARRKEIKPLMTFKTNDEAKRWLEEEDKKAQYSYLEWDKPITAKQRQAIADRALQEGINIAYERDGKAILNTSNVIDGEQLYNELTKGFVLGSPKEASLFLLRAGIDGIKFPAESIARGATSDNARGYNYVVFDENAITIDDVEQFAAGGLIAPNGRRSNLYFTEIYNLVRTPQFKAWFGDWEKAYKTGDYYGVSKIIDENGEPLVCYHNTDEEFYEFDEYKIGSKTDMGYYGKGFYFFPYASSDRYGKRELACFLSIKNPYYHNSVNQIYQIKTDDLKNKGYDGTIVKRADNSERTPYEIKNNIEPVEEIVAFYPEDIKLADGRNTTFDKYDADIRYAQGGVLDTLNPTGSVFADYSAEQIDKLPLGQNITTYDKTAGLKPEQQVTVYRGVPAGVTQIVSGDFVTTNKQLAKDYAGIDNVISMIVRADEILDDITEPLGEEYILRLRTPRFSAGGLIHSLKRILPKRILKLSDLPF